MKPTTTQTGPVIVPGQRVTIDRFGVTPSQITRPQGPFIIEFENRLANAAETYSVSLVSGSATTFTSTQTANTSHRGSVFLDLLPGTYRVTLQNHAALTLTITITN